MHLGWSSHVYPLDAADVARAPDYDGPGIVARDLPKDEVLLLIRPGAPDALLRGRAAVDAAAVEGAAVGVRVVFVPTVARWNLPFALMRVLRNRRRFNGSGAYHIAPEALRRLGIERAVRTLDNPQARGSVDRLEKMRRLEASLRRDGYRDESPATVMLCRTRGVEDSLRQGHHRISACLAVGIPRMTIRFAAAGALPRALARFVGRPAIRLDVLKSAISSMCGKPVRRLVPLGDGPRQSSVIVVPETGGRFVLDVASRYNFATGLASAILVPLLTTGAFVLDVAVLRTACGERSLVAWSQCALAGIVAALLGFLAVRERRARAGYGAVAALFAATSAYELLRDVLDVESNLVGPLAAVFAVLWGALAAVRRPRSFRVGVRRAASSRAFPALAIGAFLTWIAAKVVSSRAVWGALDLSEHDVKTVKHVVEEGTEFLGYALAAFWAALFTFERIKDWRRRR